MPNVTVIGIGTGRQDLTARHWELIRRADILMGGRRHLDMLDDVPVPKEEIGGHMQATVDFIRQRMADRRIVVLASGDPLFFGIGAVLTRQLGAELVDIHPNISSVAAAFARIGEPWSRARVVSLHGRDTLSGLLQALRTEQPVAVLSDPRHSPAWLAGRLQDVGLDHVALAVCERLGADDEKVAWYTPQQAAAGTFAEPNVVILKPTAFSGIQPLHLGMDEDFFQHERGLITKSEVRAVSLAKLRLRPGLTLWDLGAGSGAVGIEASLLLGAGRVIAVEQKAQRTAHIRDNARRAGVYNLEVVQAVLPAGMEKLPQPDRIFIGGGGRGLRTLMEVAAARLAPKGVMVVNTVLLANLNAALETMQTSGLDAEVVQVQISRGRPMPWSSRLAAENPVWIISGKRKDGS